MFTFKEGNVCLSSSQMSYISVSVAILAAMVIMVTAMVGYLYMQQARTNQMVQALGALVASMIPPAAPHETDEDEDDDRVSVHEEAPPADDIEVVESASTVDTDELASKTAAELKELLTKKGIPFGKRDAKTVLIQLLKASS